MLLLAAAVLLTPAAEARNPNFRFCFPQVTWATPTVDGTIAGDPGWNTGSRYVFDNGTPMHDVVVQGNKDATNLYLSFEVNNDLTFDDQDVIVLTLDADGTGANQRRLHIYPVFTGVGAATNHLAKLVEYWIDSATWNTGVPSSPPPAGVVIRVTSGGVHGTNVSWFVEVLLPRAAFGIPAAGDFGLYFNVIRVSTVGTSSTANEKFWPNGTTGSDIPPPIGLFLDSNTPDPNTWGFSSVSGSGNGVSISSSDISTDSTKGPNQINLDAPTTFRAIAHNNTVDGNGVPIAANQVRATFKIANWGIPAFGDWALVPPAEVGMKNPTLPSNIPAGGQITLSPDPWTLTSAEVTQYTNIPHQCILVELDSTAPTTLFVNKGAYHNMDFGYASKFEGAVAEISGRGYERPPQGGASHQFDLYVTTREEVAKRSENSRSRPSRDGTVSTLTWVAHGFRYTGRNLIIKKKEFEIVDHVGSFGYHVEHGGTAARWSQDLSGTDLKKVGKNIYRLPVPVDGVAKVSPRFEAIDKKRCCFVANVGSASFFLVGLGILGLVVHRPSKRTRE